LETPYWENPVLIDESNEDVRHAVLKEIPFHVINDMVFPRRGNKTPIGVLVPTFPCDSSKT
jgi:hypothetical protein